MSCGELQLPETGAHHTQHDFNYSASPSLCAESPELAPTTVVVAQAQPPQRQSTRFLLPFSLGYLWFCLTPMEFTHVPGFCEENCCQNCSSAYRSNLKPGTCWPVNSFLFTPILRWGKQMKIRTDFYPSMSGTLTTTWKFLSYVQVILFPFHCTLERLSAVIAKWCWPCPTHSISAAPSFPWEQQRFTSGFTNWSHSAAQEKQILCLHTK